MKLILAFLASCLLLSACSNKEKHYLIGVSQCSEDEWRTQMNQEILREALFYPGTDVEIRTSKDNTQQQIADIKYFIHKKVDLIIVAPNEADAITPVIEEAFDNGIPIILSDRKIHSDKYTAYVGADNQQIGQRAGLYIANLLHGKGNIIEITGLKSSTPAVERHRGLMRVLDSIPDIRIIETVDAGWFKENAQAAFDTLLNKHKQIDLVFAQNDRMAIGAYQAALEQGREKDMNFVGIDAVSGDGFGIANVIEGKLNATFIYPTGGDRVFQVAMNILQGKPYERHTTLSTALIDHTNARIMEMQTKHISALDNKINLLNKQLDAYFLRYSAQRMFLYACIIILVLVAILLVFSIRAFWTKNRMNTELSQQKSKLEEQRDQLIDLSHQLEEATHAKLAFFTNVSHDFRTPLTLIADPVDQLLASKNLDEHERAYLNIVHNNVTLLLRLINQILDFRKFENGKLAIHLSEFDIYKEMQEWTEAFRTLAFRKHIRFHVKADESSKDFLMIADAEKMERITYNLLSNAFKFTPENGAVEVSLAHITRNDDDWLCLQVSDTGIGMSAEHVQHIFEHFYQIDVHHAGSGIGLVLVKAFVEMHQGNIRVESSQKKGTTFIVEMPMKQAGTLEEGLEKNAILTNLKEGAVLDADLKTTQEIDTITAEHKETVLIIDDNPNVRDYVKMLLAQHYTVIEAANGQEGLKQAIKYVPDAIICDVMMPVMDGMECCRRLKNEIQTSHIPVMMLTAYAMDEQKIQGYECGAASYLTKPFSAKMLMVRLRNLIDNQHRLQAFFSDPTSTKQKISINDIDKTFTEKLRNLLEQNISNQEISVEDLGAQIGLSRVQLYRKTKALTGYSPNELLRITRLKKAAALLAASEKTIAEIAYETGFSSPSYFTRCYKDYFGENPTESLNRQDRPRLSS